MQSIVSGHALCHQFVIKKHSVGSRAAENAIRLHCGCLFMPYMLRDSETGPFT